MQLSEDEEVVERFSVRGGGRDVKQYQADDIGLCLYKAAGTSGTYRRTRFGAD